MSVHNDSELNVKQVFHLPLHLIETTACGDCGFESRRRNGCLPLADVVCCQVEVSATGCSLVQRSPTKYNVSGECEAKPPKARP